MKVALVHGTHYLLMPAEPGKCLFTGHGGFSALKSSIATIFLLARWVPVVPYVEIINYLLKISIT